jgi:hypothetical protein
MVDPEVLVSPQAARIAVEEAGEWPYEQAVGYPAEHAAPPERVAVGECRVLCRPAKVRTDGP